MEQEESRKRRFCNKKSLRILLIVFLSLICLACVLLLLCAGLFLHYYSLLDYREADLSHSRLPDGEVSDILEDLYEEEPFAPEESEIPEESRVMLDESIEDAIKDPVDPPEEEREAISHILVIGMDVTGVDKRARSDVMIVVSVNENTGRIVLTSLLRDVYLSIPDYPNNRLNAAFALGGVGLLQNTLKANFGIEIDRYVAIDFSAFTAIIDTLGGIDLTLTEDDCKNVFPGQNKQPGVYRLDGQHALTYARWRKGASDFERTERQRTLMTTVINRMLGMSISELTDVMETTFPMVRTDLTEWDCLSILMNAGDLTDYEIDNQRIPFAGTWEYVTINRKSVLTLDLEENRRLFFESVLKNKAE